MLWNRCFRPSGFRQQPSDFFVARLGKIVVRSANRVEWLGSASRLQTQQAARPAAMPKQSYRACPHELLIVGQVLVRLLFDPQTAFQPLPTDNGNGANSILRPVNQKSRSNKRNRVAKILQSVHCQCFSHRFQMNQLPFLDDPALG